MNADLWRVIGYGLVVAGVYAGLMTLIWALCVAAGRADEAQAKAADLPRADVAKLRETYRLTLVRGKR